MKVAFLVGSAQISGGTFVIFQHALHLTRAGHEVAIITEAKVPPEDVEWHQEAWAELRFVAYDEIQNETFDVAIATWWRTVFLLSRVDAKKYLYFVQSIESRFYPHSERSAQRFVESTYCMGLSCIAVASWIKGYLESLHDLQVGLAFNGIRKDLFTEMGPAVAPRVPGKLRVLVEGPLGVFFKNTERTIELSRQSKAAEVWLLTSSPLSGSYPGADRVFSRVPITETPAIYRSCDVVVKLSYVEGMFAPPLEMFHCGGTAIVYDVTGHDEYIVHEKNALVVRRDDEKGVVEAINRLCEDSNLLQQLIDDARETAIRWPSWAESSECFVGELLRLVTLSSPTRRYLEGASQVFSTWYAQHSECESRLRNSVPDSVSSRLRRLGVVPIVKRAAKTMVLSLNPSRSTPP